MGFGKDGKGAIIHETNVITLATLADATALLADGGIAIEDDFRILKTEYFVGLNAVIAVGDGPIYFGIADGDLTIAEIAELLVMTGPLDRNDNTRTERALRPVWLLESFGTNTDTGEGNWRKGSINLRWTFSNPEAWNFFAFNQSGGGLVSGNILRYRAKHFGVWVT